MTIVRIIIPAASGKDIRRLVASGTVVTNQEKINTQVRMLEKASYCNNKMNARRFTEHTRFH